MAWAATDWIPTVCTDVRVTGRAASDVCLTGLTECFYCFFINGTAHYGFFGESGTFAIQTPLAAHTLEFGAGGVFLDGERKVDSFANATPSVETYSLTFPFRRNRSNGLLTKQGNAWLSEAQIRERGELVRDFVPCVSNGVAGLYDRVHGTLLPSATDTPFDVGETVVPAMADGDALVWSNVFTPSVATATWDGGGGASDCAFTTAANWGGDETPELSDYSTMLAFATAGTSAVMDEAVCARGLKFNTTDDFTLAATRDNAWLSIGASGGDVHVLCDDAFTYWSDLTLNGSVWVDLHGTAQNLGDVVMADTDGCITSASPARVFAFYNASSGDAVLKGCIAGAVEWLAHGGSAGRQHVHGDTCGAERNVGHWGKRVLDWDGYPCRRRRDEPEADVAVDAQRRVRVSAPDGDCTDDVNVGEFQ